MKSGIEMRGTCGMLCTTENLFAYARTIDGNRWHCMATARSIYVPARRRLRGGFTDGAYQSGFLNIAREYTEAYVSNSDITLPAQINIGLTLDS